MTRPKMARNIHAHRHPVIRTPPRLDARRFARFVGSEKIVEIIVAESQMVDSAVTSFLIAQIGHVEYLNRCRCQKTIGSAEHEPYRQSVVFVIICPKFNFARTKGMISYIGENKRFRCGRQCSRLETLPTNRPFPRSGPCEGRRAPGQRVGKQLGLWRRCARLT